MTDTRQLNPGSGTRSSQLAPLSVFRSKKTGLRWINPTGSYCCHENESRCLIATPSRKALNRSFGCVLSYETVQICSSWECRWRGCEQGNLMKHAWEPNNSPHGLASSVCLRPTEHLKANKNTKPVGKLLTHEKTIPCHHCCWDSVEVKTQKSETFDMKDKPERVFVGLCWIMNTVPNMFPVYPTVPLCDLFACRCKSKILRKAKDKKTSGARTDSASEEQAFGLKKAQIFFLKILS